MRVFSIFLFLLLASSAFAKNPVIVQLNDLSDPRFLGSPLNAELYADGLIIAKGYKDKNTYQKIVGKIALQNLLQRIKAYANLIVKETPNRRVCYPFLPMYSKLISIPSYDQSTDTFGDVPRPIANDHSCSLKTFIQPESDLAYKAVLRLRDQIEILVFDALEEASE